MTKFSVSPFVAEEISKKTLLVQILDLQSASNEQTVCFKGEVDARDLEEGRRIATAWLAKGLKNILPEDFGPLASTDSISHRDIGFEPLILLEQLYRHAPLKGKDNIALEILLTVLPYTLPQQTDITDYRDLLSASQTFLSDPGLDNISSAYTRLKEVAKDFAEVLVTAYRTNFSRASSRDTSSMSSPLKSQSPGQEQIKLGRASAFREQVLNRDKRRCLISHMLHRGDTDSFDKETLRTARFATIQACHIIPHSLNEPTKPGDNLALNQSKKNFWALANIFDPGIGNAVRNEKIDFCDNGISLSENYHNAFANLEFWFTAISTDDSSTKHIYRVEKPHNRVVYGRDLVSEEITFESQGKHVLPEPRYLAFHRALAIAANASGMAEAVPDIQEDLETYRCLSADGNDAPLLKLLLTQV